MADSNVFKPQTSSSGLGKRKMDDGQFANSPAYPEVSGFDGAGKVKPQSSSVGQVEKTPGANKGRV